MNLLEAIRDMASRLSGKEGRSIRLMEVCGTHTVQISRMGLRSVLSPYVELRSGPGCPVCVTHQADVEHFLSLARTYKVTIATFGDMLKVPGRRGSLERWRAEGADVRVFYSPLDVLELAEQRRDLPLVFLGVGFETTAPLCAFTIKEAEKRGIKNLSFLSLHKLIPPAMRVLCEDTDVQIDGFLLPGHVSTIIGKRAFEFIGRDYGIPSVVAGFEEGDILKAIYMLLNQITEGRAETENAYERLVKEEGNVKAQAIMEEVFEADRSLWRGLGLIERSGLKIRGRYAAFDAREKYPVEADEWKEEAGCICGEVLRGKASPKECPLFSSVCNPLKPFGPCMVSSEGACSAYYHYGDG